MPWFKVDDKLHDHRKARSARKAAMGVWVLAGSWCMDNLTDGFVPKSVLNRWGSAKDAAQLVQAGLWISTEVGGEKGWRFRNWSEFQPSRAEVESEREATKERVKRWREGRRGNAASNAVTTPVTNADVTPVVRPPRPDPTRPDPSTSGGDGKPSTQVFVAEWIDHCTERPPSTVIGQVSKQIKGLVDDGIDPERIRSGLAEWHRKALHPSTLPSVVHETTQRTSRLAAVPDAADWMRRRPQ